MTTTEDLRQQADLLLQRVVSTLATNREASRACEAAAQAVAAALTRPRARGHIWTADQPDSTVPPWLHMGAEDGEADR